MQTCFIYLILCIITVGCFHVTPCFYGTGLSLKLVLLYIDVISALGFSFFYHSLFSITNSYSNGLFYLLASYFEPIICNHACPKIQSIYQQQTGSCMIFVRVSFYAFTYTNCLFHTIVVPLPFYHCICHAALKP
jgi:hypothetical protein